MTVRGHVAVKWRKVSPTAASYEHLLDAQLTGKIDPTIKPPSIRLVGQCFVCFGAISAVWPLKLLPAAYQGQLVGQSQGSALYVDVILKCNCGHSHPGSEGGISGCGRTFKVGVPCD